MQRERLQKSLTCILYSGEKFQCKVAENLCLLIVYRNKFIENSGVERWRQHLSSKSPLFPRAESCHLSYLTQPLFSIFPLKFDGIKSAASKVRAKIFCKLFHKSFRFDHTAVDFLGDAFWCFLHDEAPFLLVSACFNSKSVTCTTSSVTLKSVKAFVMHRL